MSNQIMESPGSRLNKILVESSKFPEYRHAAHCCIYSPHSTPVLNQYVSSALVSMQLRFDGKIGFHGGLVHEENIIEGLNRELVEEINLNERFFVTDKDFISSHVDSPNKIILYFFAKEVSVEDFKTIEKEIFEAEDFGLETMGIFRVPMFTMSDGYCGFPAFLDNNFVRGAKKQLLFFLTHCKLMTHEEIKTAMAKSKKASDAICLDDEDLIPCEPTNKNSAHQTSD